MKKTREKHEDQMDGMPALDHRLARSHTHRGRRHKRSLIISLSCLRSFFSLSSHRAGTTFHHCYCDIAAAGFQDEEKVEAAEAGNLLKGQKGIFFSSHLMEDRMRLGRDGNAMRDCF